MVTQHYQARNFQGRSCVGYLLRSAQLVLANHIDEAVTPHEMTFTQWVILMHLREGLAFNASSLCERLRYDSGALTRVIDQLETRGWLQRVRSAADRRSVELSLTRAGGQLLDELLPKVIERMNWVLRDFSRSEVSELTRLLAKLGEVGHAQAQGAA